MQAYAQDQENTDYKPTSEQSVDSGGFKGKLICPQKLYPRESLIINEQGKALLELTVSHDGSIQNAELIYSSGSPRLDKASLEFGKKCVFQTTDNIEIKPGHLQIPVEWKIEREARQIISATDNKTFETLIRHSTPIVYPDTLKDSGNSGKVILKAEVYGDGHLGEIQVLESSHPAFEKAAIQSLSKWSFNTFDGGNKPISFQETFTFKLLEGKNGPETGLLPFKFPEQAPSKLPVEFQYDKPPRIKVAGAPVYPLGLFSQQISGSAEVSAQIDPEGNVRNVQILKATEKDFGLATKAMISSWIFEPASKNGKPSWAVFSYTQDFNKWDRDTNYDKDAYRLLSKINEHSSDLHKVDIHLANELDAKPKAIYAPAPAYPIELQQKGISDRVLVEFYIDKTGAVKLPHLLKVNNDDLGWSALTAVLRWQFEPPTVHGQPVDVVVTVPVEFGLDKGATN